MSFNVHSYCFKSVSTLILVFLRFSLLSHQKSRFLQTCTGIGLFEVLYGRTPKLPIDCVLNYNPPLHFIDLESYQHEVKRHFTNALTLVQGQIKEAQSKYKAIYDKNANHVNLNVGDLILKESQISRRGLIKKLQPIYVGPYRITKIKYPNVMIQSLDDSTKPETIHINRTKKYNSDLRLLPTSKETVDATASDLTTSNSPVPKVAHQYNLRRRPRTSDI